MDPFLTSQLTVVLWIIVVLFNCVSVFFCYRFFDKFRHLLKLEIFRIWLLGQDENRRESFRRSKKIKKIQKDLSQIEKEYLNTIGTGLILKNSSFLCRKKNEFRISGDFCALNFIFIICFYSLFSYFSDKPICHFWILNEALSVVNAITLIPNAELTVPAQAVWLSASQPPWASFISLNSSALYQYNWFRTIIQSSLPNRRTNSLKIKSCF